MKKILILILLISFFRGEAQSLDSLKNALRQSVSSGLQRRNVDTAFIVEIPATRLDTNSHRRFSIINDSIEVVRELVPLNTYETIDTLGQKVVVVDIRIMFRVLDNRTRPRSVQRYRQARINQRQREAAELISKSAKYNTDN